MSDNLNRIWLIGAGTNALDYAKVLNDLPVNYKVIGRGESSAQNFEKIAKVSVVRGGLGNWLVTKPELPDAVIVTVNVEELVSTGINLLSYGVKKILIEKPAGINLTEITNLLNAMKKHNAEIFVAYNRRFYASVLKAIEMIQDDGGVSSFHFEFTEWLHRLKELNIPVLQQQNWIYANSTHVIDLAFYLCGKPETLSTFVKKSSVWPCNTVFAGAGISDKDALFSYIANWEAPGRWGLDVLTKKNKYILRPLEKLQIQKLGSVNIEEVEINNELDNKYKPGFYNQIKTFLNKTHNDLLPLEEHIENFKIYEKINSNNSIN